MKGEPLSNQKTPYEVAQSFAAGEISRKQLVNELSGREYTAFMKTDGYDSVIVDPPGSFSDVTKAFTDGLIDASIYNEIIGKSL